jgi:hypothetical protein
MPTPPLKPSVSATNGHAAPRPEAEDSKAYGARRDALHAAYCAVPDPVLADLAARALKEKDPAVIGSPVGE